MTTTNARAEGSGLKAEGPDTSALSPQPSTLLPSWFVAALPAARAAGWCIAYHPVARTVCAWPLQADGMGIGGAILDLGAEDTARAWLAARGWCAAGRASARAEGSGLKAEGPGTSALSPQPSALGMAINPQPFPLPFPPGRVVQLELWDAIRRAA